MYAVVKDGGREFKVERGDEVLLDRKDLEPGSIYNFSDVLLVSDGQTTLIGKPTLNTANVSGTVVGEVKGKKVVAFKYRRRKDSKSKKGHRQKYTKVEITSITAEGIATPEPEPVEETAQPENGQAEGVDDGA